MMRDGEGGTSNFVFRYFLNDNGVGFFNSIASIYSSVCMPADQSNISRRKFLKLGAAAGLGMAAFSDANRSRYAVESHEVSFGIVADVHYAYKDMRINRFYRESLVKLRQGVETFNASRLPFVVMLGDFIDKAPDKTTELKNLAAIREAFSFYRGPKHFVMGNHDLANLSKTEYLTKCGAVSPDGYYSLDAGGYHFVILDANFRQDGEAYNAGNFKWKDAFIPAPQQEWLAQDLQRANGTKAVVFVHQNLHDESGVYGVKNADAVRRIFERSGNVLAVMQGHDHKGAYAKINGIHYVTLKAMVDGSTLRNNAYALITIDLNNRLSIRGFGKEKDFILN
jgi:predicted phosphodiesterase